MTALPLPGPEKVDCPDGCGKFGRPLKTRSGHVRGCPCRPCLGGRSSKTGKSKHRLFTKRAGIVVGYRRSSDEERWVDAFRWEIKSGLKADPVVTAYENARAQSEETRAFGDPRPFAFGAVPTKSGRPWLVVIDADVWRELIVPLLESAR